MISNLDTSTIIELAAIVFAAGGIYQEIKAGRKESREKIEKIEAKLNNGITSKLESILVSGAERGQQLDNIQKHVDAMLKDCPIVHAIVFNKSEGRGDG